MEVTGFLQVAEFFPCLIHFRLRDFGDVSQLLVLSFAVGKLFRQIATPCVRSFQLALEITIDLLEFAVLRDKTLTLLIKILPRRPRLLNFMREFLVSFAEVVSLSFKVSVGFAKGATLSESISVFRFEGFGVLRKLILVVRYLQHCCLQGADFSFQLNLRQNNFPKVNFQLLLLQTLNRLIKYGSYSRVSLLAA